MSTPTHVRALRNAPVRAHWNDARLQFAAAIERASWRALETLPETPSNKGEVLSVLADAIVSVVHDGAVVDLALYAWTPEAPALLGALRHELLCGRTRREWDSGDLLAAVTAIEKLCASLEGDVAVRFARQFSGRDAQQRLIELAHDMRSPLNAILLLVERLQHGRDGHVSPAQQHHLALVYSAAYGLSSMANDLMEVARGGARLLAEPPRAFSLSDMLRAVRDVVQPLAAERRLALRLSSPRHDLRVGQESALTRVLLNLTTNALKFTTVGSVTVTIEQGSTPDALHFVVEDTGQGMPQEALDEIFPSAGVIAAGSPQSFSADGLGLAICGKLVSAMGGTLQADSRVDQGTRFTFTLQLPAV